MKISSNTSRLVNELSEYSGGKLKNIHELSLLVELAENSKKDKLFHDIQFTAKYLNGLGKILQSNVALTTEKKPGSNGAQPPTAEEAREKIMGEYKANIIKFTNYLKDLIIDAEDSERKEIEDKYLALSRTSMVNLTTLIYDLSWLKRFLNSKR